jgi:ParB/RepB/Spo0J family partition protein
MLENPVITVKLVDIVTPYLLLRIVNKRSLDYLELRDSISAHGVLNSILVRRSTKFEGKYEIIDGMYRYSCVKDIGLKQIGCTLVTASDQEALLMQVQANMQRPPTKRAEFAMHLKRLFAADSDLTFDALSARLNKNPGWIRDTLKLVRLCDTAKRELDSGNLTLVAAYAMCRLPQKMQEEFLPKAICMGGRDAANLCNEMAKDYFERIIRGRSEVFFNADQRPQPHLRNCREVRRELNQPLCGSVFLSDQDYTPLQIWRLALSWVLHLDPDSLKAHSEKHQIKLSKMEQEIIERRKTRETLKKQRDLGLSDDWRISLIED